MPLQAEFSKDVSDRLNRVYKPSFWPWRLFLFSFFVFLTSLFIYFGVDVGYRSFLDSEIKSADNSIKKLESSISSEDKNKFLTFYSQLSNLDSIIKNKTNSASIFSLIESTVRNSVVYDSIDYKSGDLKIILTGRASSFNSFSEQIEVIKRNSFVSKVVVSDVDNKEDGIHFRFSILLKNKNNFIN